MDVISAPEAGLGGRGGITGLGDEMRVELGGLQPAEGYTLEILARGLWKDFGCIVELQQNVNTSLTFWTSKLTHNFPLQDAAECTGDSNTSESWLRSTNSTDLFDTDGRLENPTRVLVISPFPVDTPGGIGTGLRSGEGDGDGTGEGGVALGPREGGGGGGLLMPNWRSEEDEVVRR